MKTVFSSQKPAVRRPPPGSAGVPPAIRKGERSFAPNAAIVSASPLSRAARKTESRGIILSGANTAQWEAQTTQAIRDRAFFSATLTNAKFAAQAKQTILSTLRLEKEKLANGKEAWRDRSTFIADLRKTARDQGMISGTEKGIKDFSSSARLGLIFDVQTQQAQNYARYAMDMAPELLNAWPAQELIRAEERQVPRNWAQRWAAAGGQVFGGRMIALKTDPVWTRISRFGTPYPPFDFGSGMDVADVSRSDAIALGLISPEFKAAENAPEIPGFNDTLAAEVADLTPQDLDGLLKVFGPSVKLVEGILHWVPK